MDAATELNKGTKHAADQSVVEKASKLLKIMSNRTDPFDDEKKNVLLRLFIEYAQEGYYECSWEESEYLKDWISKSKIDVNQKDWINSYESIVEDMDWNRRKKKPILLAYMLKDLLPILFKCNDNVNYTDEDGKTILHVFLETCANSINFCSYDKSLKVPHFAKRLIDMGASVNIADKQGITPVHIAAKGHHKDLLKMMLKDFTNVHSCDEEGNTILHYVVSKFINDDRMPLNGFGFVVCALLIKGADMHRRNKSGMTPVHIAAKYSHLELLKIFLYCGADVNLRTNDGETALVVLCKNLAIHDDDGVKGGVAELLLKCGCDKNATDKDGYSALHLAYYPFDCIVKMLVERGADVHCRTKEFQLTPLHLASHWKIFKRLIEAGAEVDAKAVDGMTPLLLAAMKSDLEEVKYLIERGAAIKARDKLFGFTALHMSSVDRLRQDKLEFLLGQGFDVNDGGKYGITPLHLASLAGHIDNARILIQRGANVNCQDKTTRSTPLHFASMKADAVSINNVINRIAAEKGKIPVKPSWKVSKFWLQKHDDVIELLIKSGADVNVKDSNGKPALQK